MTPDDIRNLKNNVFTTYKDMDECFTAVDSMFHSKKHKATAMLLLGITVNTAVEVMAQCLEEETKINMG